jgi:hypothetical protein
MPPPDPDPNPEDAAAAAASLLAVLECLDNTTTLLFPLDDFINVFKARRAPLELPKICRGSSDSFVPSSIAPSGLSSADAARLLTCAVPLLPCSTSRGRFFPTADDEDDEDDASCCNGGGCCW